MAPLRALVIGAGIGGTAAAIALRRAGLDVLLFEQAAAQSEVGAGIQISPNASRLLARYGLAKAMARTAVRPTAIEVRRWQDGRLLARDELGDAVEARYGAPYYHFHRADLIALLGRAMGDESLRMGARLVDVEQRPDGVTALFEDGSRADGDLLIGADGIHSRVRHILFGPERPRFSGHVAYRGLVPAERIAHLGLERAVTNWMGPQGHFVHYFVAGGRYLNFVAVTEQSEWTREHWSDRAEPGEASRYYAGWHPQVHAILNAVDASFKWALFDREPLPRWARGRVTLLGDACHPMLPYMAQGAAQAIEDGATLAACLSGHGSDGIAEALAAYEALRQPRAGAVQAGSRANATTYHLPDGTEQQARDAALATKGARAGRTAELYGHDAETVGPRPAA